MSNLSLGLGLVPSFLGRLLSGFSLASLFAASEQGVWYDPSDLTSMYQDSAGTTAAAVGQPVGLMLDKSQGLVRGPELVTNGGFDSGFGSGWVNISAGGGTAVISGGNLSITTDATGRGGATQSFPTVAGKTYNAAWDGSGVNLSNGQARIGTTSSGGEVAIIGMANASTVTFVAASSPTYISFTTNAASTADLKVDNVSVREIPGNHATQATTASKPILARHPVGGRRNLLTYTEDFGNAAWNIFASSLTISGLSLRETATTSEHYVEQVVSQTGTQTYTIEVKSVGRDIKIMLGTSSGTYAANYSFSTEILSANGTAIIATSSTVLADGYHRLTVTSNAGANRFRIQATNGGTVSYAGDTSKGLDVRSLQLETGSTATAYQRVGSQYNVTEAGKADLWYLAFDGFDDWMSTGSINFTSTDEMTVIAGVRKLSDAAAGALVELSATSSTNGGTFAIFAPSGAANNYLSRSRGSTGASGDAVDTGFTAPISNALTGLSKISTDMSVLRVDGVQEASSSADQGAGNYGNYPLYIGRRGGTSIPLNGHLYGLVVRGALTAGDTLTKSEEAVSQKTYGDAVFGVPPAEGGISYVGGASAGFDGSTSPNNSLSLTSLSGGSGSAPAAGDVIVVMYASGTQGDIDLSATGYTEIVELWADDSRDANLSAFYKIAGAGETAVSLSPTGSTSYGAVAIAKVFRGVDNVTPLDVTTTTATGLDNIYADPPAITPITDGAMIVAAGAAGVSAGAAAFSSSDLDSFLSLAHDEGVDVVLGVGQKAWTGGAFNPATFTDGGTDSTANSWAAITLALRPA